MRTSGKREMKARGTRPCWESWVVEDEEKGDVATFSASIQSGSPAGERSTMRSCSFGQIGNSSGAILASGEPGPAASRPRGKIA